MMVIDLTVSQCTLGLTAVFRIPLQFALRFSPCRSDRRNESNKLCVPDRLLSTPFTCFRDTYEPRLRCQRILQNIAIMSARLTRISLESVGFLGSLFNNLLPVSMRPCTPCLRRQYAVGIEGGSSQHRSQSLHEGPKKPQVPTESPGMRF
jgi:hypothetical protein